MSVPRFPSFGRHRSCDWNHAPPVDIIEIDLSCPRMATCDVQLCQQPEDTALVARTVCAAIGSVSFRWRSKRQ